MNLQRLIKAKGFDYVNDNITESNFPVPARLPSKETEYKLFHFDRYISSEDAIKEIEKEGYNPANLYELLSWPDWKDEWVVALGSVASVNGGSSSVPCLGSDGSERDLILDWFGRVWLGDCRFLAVRNSGSVSSESSPSDTLTELSARIKALEDWKRKIIKTINE